MSKRYASEIPYYDASPDKKIKTEGPEPICFTSPGMKTIDTCIVVFGQEFHVNSNALKMLSMFFQRFLEPLNIASQPERNPVAAGEFKYEWFTAIDTDEETKWFLSSDPKDRDSDVTGFKGDPALEERCFHNILRAIFCRQALSVYDVEELRILTKMADYYLCLPAVSNSLYATMLNNESLSRSIAQDPCNALNCAYELRHPSLFRESMIYALGPWSKPRYEQLESEKLRTLAAFIRAKMEKRLYKIDCHLRLIQANKEVYGDITQKYFSSILNLCFQPGVSGEEGYILYPQYYRRLCNNNTNSRERIPDNLMASLRRTLDPVVKNNLKMDTIGLNSGIGGNKDAFLCFEVQDHELPWDIDQLDWINSDSAGEDFTQNYSFDDASML